MKQLKGMVVLLAALLAMSAFGCSKKEGPAEKAGKEIDKAAEKTGAGIEKAAEKSKEAIDKTVDKTKETVKDATSK